MTAEAALSTWQGAPVETWRERWRLPRLIVLGTTTSTNDVARVAAEHGAPAGLLVMAEHQTAGRGRMGRRWADEPGRSLLLSFLLRPAPADGDPAPGTAPLRVGMAVARAIRDACGIEAGLEWPNDIVAPGGGKLAGILCEAATVGGETVVIAGIGINAAQQPGDFAADLRRRPTSIAIEAGTPPDRAHLAGRICDAVRPLFTAPLRRLSRDERDAFDALHALHERPVVARGGEVAEGTVEGVDPDGALLVRSGGTRQRITSATIRPADRQTSSTTPPRS